MRFAILSVALLMFAAPAAGQIVRQLTAFTVNHLESYAADDAGSMVFFVSDIDPSGSNPGSVMQVFRKTLPGTDPVQVTTLDADASMVSVSDDGAAVLFRSSADPLGFNADGGSELFLTDADGGSMVQLTDHPAGRDVDEAVLSGDGGTVLFISNGDPAAQNPSLFLQLFAVDANGTNLRQLTLALQAGLCSDIAISDDGQRVVFIDDRDLTGNNEDRSAELFAVAGDGTGMSQVTNKAMVQAAAIAGQGTPIVYEEEGDLYQIDWGSNHPTYLVSGSDPGVTDLGDLVYYFDSSSPRVLFKIDPEDDPVVPVEVWSAGTIASPVISGAGTCLLFSLTGEGAPFLANPDDIELLATDADGLSPEQVVEVDEDGYILPFEMTADGSRIAFPWGNWTLWESLDLFIVDTGTANVTKIIDRAGSTNPAISDDGNTIVFFSYKDLVPDGCEVGGIYRINADGSGLQQLSPDPVTCDSYPYHGGDHPSISNDASTVVYQAYPYAQLEGVSSAGGPVWPVTDDDDGMYKTPRIDGTGAWATYMSGSNITGQNPDRGWEVFRVRMDGTSFEQISTEYGERPDISADGERIVFGSPADPFGTNPELNYEIFLYDTALGTTEQLTVTTSGENRLPRISPNGSFVAFYSTSPWVSSSELSEVYRLELASGEVQLASAGIGIVTTSVRLNVPIDVDDAGNVAFCGDADLVGLNSDLSLELWLAEFDAEPPFNFEAGNLLRWGPSPSALSYDVIRGNLTALASGLGGTVDLGVVACLEDDSPDAMTTVVDSDLPASGQGFFYLYRGAPGDLLGAGSWGGATGGAERIPAGGSCPDGF